MTSSAGLAAFEARYAQGIAQTVERRLSSDLDTPVSAFLKLAAPPAVLLESVEGGETLGRYSVIAWAPDRLWHSVGGRPEIQTNGGAFESDPRPLRESLAAFVDDARCATPQGAPPMTAGVFGYLGYDFAREIEKLPPRKPSPADVPEAVFIRPTLVAIFDNVRHEILLSTPARPKAGVSAQEAHADAVARLDEAASLLSRPLEPMSAGSALAGPVASNMSPTDYQAMAARAREYIAAGDIFQVVLSQRFSAPLAAPPFALYRALRRVNPSPFLFYLDFGTHQLAGSSPEILVRARDGVMTVRPIAGTRRRGRDAAEDAANAEALLADPKERAEHLMLLDLGRNDVGRVCRVGSVRVTESFAVERYSHVMHIVSNVEGALRDGVSALDALAAGFPAGTVSGAPKIRAMEIIDELERDGRGVYGGAVGYFAGDGSLDACIALRTAIIKDGRMHVQAGAGIVADSDPLAEHRECEAKAAALFDAARSIG
ncbi:MAG: anthranilate synthase component I [Parvularculaceae bacterium]|nr:anthranilate synthase component I [Parvularculaceae bacterium]